MTNAPMINAPLSRHLGLRPLSRRARYDTR